MYEPREGKNLSDQLERMLEKLDPEGKKSNRQHELFRAWREITGPVTVEHTKGIFAEGSKVVVIVDSPLWAQELSLLAPTYKEKLNEYLPHLKASAITFRVQQGRRF